MDGRCGQGDGKMIKQDGESVIHATGSESGGVFKSDSKRYGGVGVIFLANLTWPRHRTRHHKCVSSDRESDGKPKISYVTVFERPGLHEFLAQLSKFADLVLFTAGLEGYARPLVDRIDAENRFSRRLYRPSTISTEYREHVKDLSFVSTDFCRMVIVDNNPFSFLLQPVNGIPCIPFSAGQPRDDQLLEVLLPLLKQLSEQRDV
nr:CTD nuclear envelope phosphatase 1 homolog [Tanacetum cinerariifolium]